MAVATAAALTTATSEADARLSWCFGDPIVQIGEEVVAINVYVPEESLDALENPVDVVIHVPAGVPTSIIEMNTPFFEERVRFVEEPTWRWEPGKSMPVSVEVFVRASERFRVKVEVVYDGPHGEERTLRLSGRSNDWITTWLRIES